MKNISIIILFLIVKIFQWINSLVLTKFFSFNESLPLMSGALLFVTTIFVSGLLFKKFLPDEIYLLFVVIMIVLFIFFFVDLSLMVTFLAGFFLYGLIGAEAQVFQLLSSHRKIPRFLLLSLSFLPIIVSFPFFQSDGISSQFFYIISSIFAFFASYSTRFFGEKEFVRSDGKTPAWVGLFLMLGSSVLFINKIYEGEEMEAGLILPMVLFFYAGGAMIVYISITERLQKIIKKK